MPERLHAEAHAAFAARQRRRRAARGRHRGRRGRAVRDRRRRGRLARSSARSRAGRKNRLWLEVDGAEEALAFSQEEPETLWVGRREASTLIKRDPGIRCRRRARSPSLPAGHPQGYADCFDAFVAEVYDAVARGEAPPDGLPLFADGLRAAQITDAVLRSAREERWVDVPAIEAAEVAG